MYKMFLSGALLFSAALANAQSIRLVAEASYNVQNNAYVKTDTMNLFYSFGRGALPEESGYVQEKWAADSMVYWLSGGGQDHEYMRYYQQFDNNGRLAKMNRNYYLNNAWDSLGRNTYHYTNNKLDTIYMESHNTGSWAPGAREIYVYNQYGLTIDLYQSYNASLSQYENTSRNVYMYNSSGQQIEWRMEQWQNNAWAFTQRFTYVYDGNNLDTTYFFFGSIPGQDGFVVHTFDVNNDNIENMGYAWNSTNNTFEIETKRIAPTIPITICLLKLFRTIPTVNL